MIFKREKERRKRNPLLYQRPLANKCRGIKAAENQYSSPIRLECEATEESILTGAKGICRQLAKSREKCILSLSFQLLNPTLFASIMDRPWQHSLQPSDMMSYIVYCMFDA